MNITLLQTDGQSIAISVWYVCLSALCFLSVCLSVGSHISKTRCPNFTKFAIYVTCGRSLVLLWQQCNMLCTSGFVDDDRSFSHSGANGPKWRRRVCFVEFAMWRIWGKGCRLRLHLVIVAVLLSYCSTDARSIFYFQVFCLFHSQA